jgi:hypothetical protein
MDTYKKEHSRQQNEKPGGQEVSETEARDWKSEVEIEENRIREKAMIITKWTTLIEITCYLN